MITQEIKYAYTDAEMDEILKLVTYKRANRVKIVGLLLSGKLKKTGGEP